MILLNNPDALGANGFRARLAQDATRPHAVARLFGTRTLILYTLWRGTLDGMLRRLGERLSAVELPLAEAAADVGMPEDLVLVERILAERPAA